ncbi:MAG: DUF2207 domain-containing protein [Spirochaetales bacterium]|nr:DUF2207 domain-containing protein [Spirochaetales bacterium]
MRKFVLPLILLLCSTLLFGAADYSIESLESRVVINDGGVWDVSETIVMHFHKPLHGFYRHIPYDYGETKVKISRIKASDTLRIDHKWDSVILRLGDADRTVTGRQEYSIRFRYDIGGDRYPDYDEFYYNLVGDGWEVPIENFSFSITFPKPIEEEKVSFTTGKLGSVSSEGITWSLSPDRLTLEGKISPIGINEALTVRVEMEEGYYAERFSYERVARPIYCVLMPLTLLLAAYLWHRHGKDEELIIVPQFDPPSGMSPLDVGYLIDGSLDSHDVTAMLFYWADKGCLTIVEEGKEVSFIRGRDPKGASRHEQKLYDDFFSFGSGGIVKAKDLEGKFAEAYKKIAQQVKRYYTKENSLESSQSLLMRKVIALLLVIPALGFAFSFTGIFVDGHTLFLFFASLLSGALFLLLLYRLDMRWYVMKRFKQVLHIILIFFVALVSFFILLFSGGEGVGLGSLALIVLTLVGNLALALFAVITKQRCPYGQRQLELILGLRDFIERVEMDQLQRMIKDDPQFYYHVLSFAIVLGLEKKWAKKFENIMLEPPSWYAGSSRATWNAIAISSILSRTTSTMGPVYKTISKGSGSGGFGGSFSGSGGFSGGGFGGGGGGAW